MENIPALDRQLAGGDHIVHLITAKAYLHCLESGNTHIDFYDAIFQNELPEIMGDLDT